jgi:hypothetical protein
MGQLAQINLQTDANVWIRFRIYLLNTFNDNESEGNEKARCNGDILRAGKSSWQVDYQVSDRQQDCKVAEFWTRSRAIWVNE